MVKSSSGIVVHVIFSSGIIEILVVVIEAVPQYGAALPPSSADDSMITRRLLVRLVKSAKGASHYLRNTRRLRGSTSITFHRLHDC